jgi:hypothetical protein
MGCDIHLTVEVKKNKKWKHFEKTETLHYGVDNKHSYERSIFNPGRCYDLFAILADVRNGRGFAGCKTGEGFDPISDPRGVPKDASPEYKAAVKDAEGDGHSHSYHTLKQLQDYPWKDKKVIHTKLVDLKTYERWKASKELFPTCCCGDAWSTNIIKLPEDEYPELKSNPEKYAGKEIYIQARWETTYYDSVEFFVDNIMPKLAELGPPEDVRICFFFDN